MGGLQDDIGPHTPDQQPSPVSQASWGVAPANGTLPEAGPNEPIEPQSPTTNRQPATVAETDVQTPDSPAISPIASTTSPRPSPIEIPPTSAAIPLANGLSSWPNGGEAHSPKSSGNTDSKAEAEKFAADAMEALSLAAASGASGGSVPFGSPVHTRPANSAHRAESSLAVGTRLDLADADLPPMTPLPAPPTAATSSGMGIFAQPIDTSDEAAVGSKPFTLDILGGDTARGIQDGEESDWGSLDEPYPLTPGPDGAQSGPFSDDLQHEQPAANGNSSGEGGGNAFMNGDAHLTAEDRLQQALARIAELEGQNVALWEEMQQEGSDDASMTSDSPTAAEADRLSGGGSGRAGRVGRAARLARVAARFSQDAMDAKEDELKNLQQRCMQFEVEVEQELEDLNGQLFRAQQQVHVQQQAFTGSEAKRQQMQSAKQMVEAQLQETGQQLMECEALLIQAGRVRPPKMTPPKKEGGSTPRGGEGTELTPAESPGTPILHARSGHPFFNSLLQTEVEQLKEENDALMTELVGKKMAFAELSESFARVKRDLHRREARDRAVTSKMSRMHAILGSNPSFKKPS